MSLYYYVCVYVFMHFCDIYTYIEVHIFTYYQGIKKET